MSSATGSAVPFRNASEVHPGVSSPARARKGTGLGSNASLVQGALSKGGRKYEAFLMRKEYDQPIDVYSESVYSPLA